MVVGGVVLDPGNVVVLGKDVVASGIVDEVEDVVATVVGTNVGSVAIVGFVVVVSGDVVVVVVVVVVVDSVVVVAGCDVVVVRCTDVGGGVDVEVLTGGTT